MKMIEIDIEKFIPNGPMVQKVVFGPRLKKFSISFCTILLLLKEPIAANFNSKPKSIIENFVIPRGRYFFDKISKTN